ncbi:hypothetical protein [Nocardioides marmoraquaticus]
MEPHRPPARTRRGARPAAAVVVALLLTASGCSWFGDDEPATNPTPAPVAEGEAPVEVIGAVDPDAVDVGEAQPAPETGQGYYFVSDLYPVSGPRLDQPVLVRMTLDSVLPEGTPVTVAARADDSAPWRFVDGTLDADGSHVEFIVPELATFGVLAIDPDSVRRRLGEAVDAALEEDATRPDDVDPATCDDTAGAREGGYVAKSWRRSTVSWCLDRDGESRVLRLTNTRGVPIRLNAPGVADRGTTGDAVRPDVDWDAWTAAVATGAAGGDGDGDGTATVLAPGQTLEVDADLEPGSSLLVTAADDARNRGVQVLHGAALGLATQVADLGLVAPRRRPDGEEVLARLLATPGCAAALGGPPARLAKACLGERALGRALDRQAPLVTPVLTPTEATALVRDRLRALGGAAARVEQRLEVSRDLPDFGPLVGRFTGTARSIVVGADGLVTESWGTAAGPALTIGYQLSDPSVAKATGTATATVTAVQVIDRAAAGARAPRVGQAGVLTLGRDGVVRSPFVGATYCNGAGAAAGRCTDAPVVTPSTPRGGGTGKGKGGKGSATSPSTPAPTPGPERDAP